MNLPLPEGSHMLNLLIPVRFNYSLRTLSPLNIIQRKLLQSLIPGLPNATQQWDIIPAAMLQLVS